MELKPYLQLEHKGLEISEAYYRQVGRPAIDAALPEYADRAAYGLVGEGSECFGFDDLISTDHDYGPSFCIWLTHEDYLALGEKFRAVYESLPGEFMGLASRQCRRMAGDRVGVLDMDLFYARFLGRPAGPQSNLDWLALPDEYLAVATNGKIFEDQPGRFSGIRARLLAYYPEDVRRKKLSAALLRAAHAGQANYARMMRRGDAVTAGDAAAKFIDNAISVIYLLNKTYAPYYKWRFQGLANLPILGSLSAPLEELASLGFTGDSWTKERTLDLSAVNRGDRRAALIEEICHTLQIELIRQFGCRSTDSYTEPYAFEIYESIRDPQLKQIHILKG